MRRREFVQGMMATTALGGKANAQWASFQAVATAVSTGGGGGGGGLGTAQLQVAGIFSEGNRTRDPKDYYTPGNESPGISTSEYYHMNSLQLFRPWDLDAMGSPGATVKAANGGNRYAWICAFDHPEGGSGIHNDCFNFMIGFSDDPGILPSVLIGIIPFNNQWVGDASTPGANGFTMNSDFGPSALVYNPDDASFPFYLYTQGAPLAPVFHDPGLQSVAWKSSDLFSWVGCAWGPKSLTDANIGDGALLTSHQLVIRNGTGNWSTFGIVGHYGYMGPNVWTSADGKTWDYSETSFNLSGKPSINLTIDAFSSSPNRLTASSAIFSPSDTGKGICLYSSAAGSSNNNSTQLLMQMTYVSATQVDVTGQYGGGNIQTFTNQPVPLSYGPVSYRKAPAPDGSSAIGAFGALGAWGIPFTPGNSSQSYQICVEDDRQNGINPNENGMWASMAPIDSNYNVSQSVSAIRISSQYLGAYSGPSYLQQAINYAEDGIQHVYVGAGYPGPHGTALTPYVGATLTGGVTAPSSGISVLTVDSVQSDSFIPIGGFLYSANAADNIGQILSQTSGTPGGAGSYLVENFSSVTVSSHTANVIVNSGRYNYSAAAAGSAGHFDNQFIDYYTVAYDSILASDAAPFGVAASCNNNTVSLSWMSTPLGTGAKSQSYNVYKGTSSGTQSTLVSNTSGLSLTDTPTANQQWWYKVMKVSGGSETKSRVVSVYVG